MKRLNFAGGLIIWVAYDCSLFSMQARSRLDYERSTATQDLQKLLTDTVYNNCFVPTLPYLHIEHIIIIINKNNICVYVLQAVMTSKHLAYGLMLRSLTSLAIMISEDVHGSTFYAGCRVEA